MKKELEKLILRKVYPQNVYEIIDDGEEPDFIIKHQKSIYRFGVEITELYKTESSARLINIPNYTSELLNKKAYRHKDDKLNLKVDTIKFSNQEKNEEFEAIAVIQSIPATNEYLGNFLKCLENKEAKYSNYITKDLGHINLIISDQEDYFNTTSLENFYSNFFTLEVINRIKSSPFREIFFITKIEESHYFVYLKSIYFLSEFWSFREYCIEENKDYVNQNFIKLFLYYCSLSNIEGITINTSETSIFIYYSDLLILTTEDRTTVSRAFDVDYDSFDSYKRFIESFNPPDWIFKKFEEYRKGKAFATTWFTKVE